MPRKKPYDGRSEEDTSDLQLRQEEARRRLEEKVDRELEGLEVEGRPDAYLIREFFRAFNTSMTITGAAAACGFSPRRVRTWKADVPGFEDLLDDYLKVQRLERLEESLYQRAVDPSNPTGAAAAMFILKGRDRATFGEKLEVDTRVTVQHVIQEGNSAREKAQQAARMLQERRYIPSLPALPLEDVVDVTAMEVEHET